MPQQHPNPLSGLGSVPWEWISSMRTGISSKRLPARWIQSTLSKPDTSLNRTANLVLPLPAELHLYLCNWTLSKADTSPNRTVALVPRVSALERVDCNSFTLNGRAACLISVLQFSQSSFTKFCVLKKAHPHLLVVCLSPSSQILKMPFPLLTSVNSSNWRWEVVEKWGRHFNVSGSQKRLSCRRRLNNSCIYSGVARYNLCAWIKFYAHG